MSRFALLVMVLSLLGPFFISVMMTAWVRGWAIRRGFVDHPGGHKAHARPIALGGGIAITAALVLPLVLAVLLSLAARVWLPASVLEHVVNLGDRSARLGDLLGGVVIKVRPAMAILAGAIVLHILGVLDDVRPLGPGFKMIIMLAVGLVLTAGFGIRSLDVLGPGPAVVLTTLWIVLVTNAFNFMDNMDGLSAGVAVITATVFAAASLLAGQVFVPALGFMLVGAAMGFLLFNFPPASIFMGDAGSLVVGYFMAVLTVLTHYYDPAEQQKPFGMLAPLIVLAVPIYDVVSVVVARLRERVSPFRGDRRHFSHRLVRRGLRTRSAVLTIYLATAATGCSALLLPAASWALAAVIGAQCLCIVLIVAILESVGGADEGQTS